jgi:uncharacterized iron-regulated protein
MGLALLLLAILGLAWGCSVPTKTLLIKDNNNVAKIDPGTIIQTATGQPISFAKMVADLERTRIVYIGETHTDPSHHEIQLKILQTLTANGLKPKVGMEMFDSTYQTVLDSWRLGKLSNAKFLESVHWYANWRFDFDLYREILEFIRDNQIQLVGLNIPGHIPPKISVGGIHNLRDWEAKHLPQRIDTSDAEHRAYVEEIFGFHNIRGRENFEYFYAAQCVWEDAMAETIAATIGEDFMVVLAGNGHIKKKFGIPKRAYSRTKLPYRTIYLTPAGSQTDLDDGDYIWVTPPINPPKMPSRMKK